MKQKFSDVNCSINSAAIIRQRYCFWVTLSVLMLSNFWCGRCAPWQWGYASYLLSWKEGFLPRSFLGTIFSTLLRDTYYSKAVLDTIMFFVEFLFAAYLVFVIFKLCVSKWNTAGSILLLIFSTSTFPMFYFQIIGYLEHYGFLLIALNIEICLRKKLYTCVFVSSVSCLIAVLILETNAFIVCPAIFSVLLIRLCLEKGFTRSFWVSALKCIGLHSPTFLYIIMVPFFRASNEQVEKLRTVILEKATDVPLLLDCGLDYSLSFFSGTSRLTSADKLPYVPVEIIIYTFVPVCLLSIFLTETTLEKGTKRLTISLMLLCSLASYAANFIATDYNRFFAFMFMAPMMVSIYIYRAINIKEEVKLSKGSTIFMVALSVVVLLKCAGYRLWTWNRIYHQPWWVELIETFLT
jgi:hypothetical protein